MVKIDNSEDRENYIACRITVGRYKVRFDGIIRGKYNCTGRSSFTRLTRILPTMAAKLNRNALRNTLQC